MDQQVKNLLRAQSKYGLMGSSAKTGKNFSTGHRSSFLIKLSFGIGHPPPIYQMQCICVGEGSRVPVIPTLSPLSPHCPHSPQEVPMWSPRLWSPWSPPMLSPLSSHHPHIVPIIATLSRRSPDHSQPPRYPPHPPCVPLGVGVPKSLKMQ